MGSQHNAIFAKSLSTHSSSNWIGGRGLEVSVPPARCSCGRVTNIPPEGQGVRQGRSCPQSTLVELAGSQAKIWSLLTLMMLYTRLWEAFCVLTPRNREPRDLRPIIDENWWTGPVRCYAAPQLSSWLAAVHHTNLIQDNGVQPHKRTLHYLDSGRMSGCNL